MAIQYPLINGRYYSHAEIEIKLFGDITMGVKSVKYSDNLEAGEVRGNHPQAIGRTLGEYKCEGSITLFLPQWIELVTKLGNGFMVKPFDLVVSYAADGLPLVTDIVRGCRIKKNDRSSEGTDAIEMPMDLHPMSIKWNGLDPIPNMLKG